MTGSKSSDGTSRSVDVHYRVVVAFDTKFLNANEDVLLDLRPHWWFITPQLALLILAIGASIVAVAVDVPQVLKWIVAAVVLAAGLNVLWRYLNWSGVNFVVTTDRLIFRTGVFTKRGVEIPLERINTVFFAQSLFERLVGSGDLTIESAGEGGQQRFADVRRPKLVQQQIYRAIELNKAQEFDAMAQAHMTATVGQPIAAPQAVGIPEQIRQLDDLRVEGVLTEAEFQTKKQELLDRM